MSRGLMVRPLASFTGGPAGRVLWGSDRSTAARWATDESSGSTRLGPLSHDSIRSRAMVHRARPDKRAEMWKHNAPEIERHRRVSRERSRPPARRPLRGPDPMFAVRALPWLRPPPSDDMPCAPLAELWISPLTGVIVVPGRPRRMRRTAVRVETVPATSASSMMRPRDYPSMGRLTPAAWRLAYARDRCGRAGATNVSERSSIGVLRRL